MQTKQVGTTHAIQQRAQHFSQTTNIYRNQTYWFGTHFVPNNHNQRICFRYILIHGHAIV